MSVLLGWTHMFTLPWRQTAERGTVSREVVSETIQLNIHKKAFGLGGGGG